MRSELLLALAPLCIYGIGGLIVLGLFIKVLVDRLRNDEDSYYEKHVKK